MKRYILIISLMCVRLNAISQVLADELYEFKSTFSDEFNSLNTNLWRTNTWNAQTQQMEAWCQEDTWFIDECVSFTNGKMKITPYTGSNIAGCGTYKSGALTTQNHFLYGYFETSVKLPQHFKASSSWWLYGGCSQSRPGDFYNEVDMFETDGIVTDGYTRPYGAVIYGTSDCAYSTEYVNDDYDGRTQLVDMTASFHTFGIEWTPEIINLYFDGNLYRSIYFLNWTKLDKKRGYKGDFISVERLKTPSVFVFWIKKYLGNNGNLPDGTKSLEADYFHYYKPKPILKAASYSYNYLTLSAASFVPDETYNWTVNSGNLSLVTQNTGTALFSVPSGFLSSTISVSGTGGYPTATATNSFEVKSSNGNFCTLNGLGNLPVIYIANDFYAPQAGCSSTVIPTGKEVIFVGNSITLNPGFEVPLGAAFSTF